MRYPENEAARTSNKQAAKVPGQEEHTTHQTAQPTLPYECIRVCTGPMIVVFHS